MNLEAKAFNELDEKFQVSNSKSEKSDLRKQAIDIFLKTSVEIFNDEVVKKNKMYEELEKIGLNHSGLNRCIVRYIMAQQDLRLESHRAYQFIFNQEKRVADEAKESAFASWKGQCEGHVFSDGSVIENGEVLDGPFGNFMFPIPKNPVDDLDAWYSDKIDDYYANCE